ncbi:hypothetical protein DUNSADRAFT_2200 [Dunaliella salina]|uniref:Magnesium transporter MgtE intracellular domain-containing protein n=1 Tax=Dunaliella salina TaxID=3046 RepID=A0ABQ7GW39_DUNSA|nr:hypothetical protein DUNSADRAFT_2200 [Dunaliella salina]|eukprot:KAF5838815.1 hypothetical protein DUNSADRAFT_2200 [Dunaliella salina]
MLIASGELGEQGDFHSLTRKVAMVKDLSAAVLQAEKRKRAFGTRRRATEFEQGPTFSSIVKSALSSAYQERWDIMDPEASMDMVMQKLPTLQSEAQVMVLASMKEHERWRVFDSLSAEQRALLLVVMSPQMREAARMALPRRSWQATMDTMQASNSLAASLLQVMEPHEAQATFAGWDMNKQAEVLAEMDERKEWHAAASIVQKLPDIMRKTLMSHVAMQDAGRLARIMQALDAKGVFSCLDGIQKQLHSSVIMQMDVPSAAAVLTEMHYEDAGECLMLESDETRRNKVLESMPHKTAANILVILDHLDKQKQEKLAADQAAAQGSAGHDQQQAQGSSEMSKQDSDEKRGSLAGSTLLSMQEREANAIMGHISYEVPLRYEHLPASTVEVAADAS